MKTYSTFEEFWQSIKPRYNDAQFIAKTAALLAWNAACERLNETAKQTAEWETAQEAKQLIV
jgi:hypothetical protein